MSAKDETLIPTTYSEWKHCITVRCGITLTRAFILERLSELRRGEGKDRVFAEIYGEAYTRQVIGWFELAERDLGS